MPSLSDTVDAADGANAAITLKDAFAQVARVAAQSPFFDAPIGAKRQPARWHFQIAPAAETPAIRSLWKTVAVGAAAGHDALSAHANKIAGK
ncbi:MAG TPA: hypothetical protein VFA65_12125 [Bryobacteraceae bacterium]|nr:hypothetical protein [Bryobacteraceae bacterium]